MKNIFDEFMDRRFPNEKDERYIREWRDRFATGSPQEYMDGISLRIYNAIWEERKKRNV